MENPVGNQGVVHTLRELHSITSNTQLSIDEKTQQLLKLGKETFGLPLAIVSRISGDQYIVEYSDTPNAEVNPGDTFELGQTYCCHTLSANGPTAFHHAGKSSINSHPCYSAFGLESYIGVPVEVSGERFGTLNFSSPDVRDTPFSSDDMELIRLFAQWIGNELSRSKAERDLFRYQGLLESMGSLARIGAWEVDIENRAVTWSSMTKEIHEVAPDYTPCLEEGIQFYKEGESRERIESAVKSAMEEGTPWNLELQIVTAKGNELWVAALGRAELRDGKCVRLYGSFQDIDERVKADNALKEAIEHSASQTSRMRLANDSAAIGVWEWNLSTDEMTWDEWMYRLYDTSEDEFSGATEAWENRLHPDDIEHANSQFERAVSGEGKYDPEYRIVRPNGEIRWLKTSAEVFRDDSGKAIKVIGVNYDITEKVTNLEKLEAAKNAAEHAARAKGEFLANMSHEIRTPMNGVIGMLQVLKNSGLNREQSKQLDIAIRSAESLLVVINDVLDVSKIDAGKLDIESINFNLRDQINEIINVLSHTIPPDAELKLISDTTGVNHPNVLGDPVRVRQIISNIINNAIKFTASGEITLTARTEKTNESTLRLFVSVQDTGIGIAPDQLEELFEEFSQADASTTRKFGGTGLGLSICKKLCELMDGTIQATSELGSGSCFTFDIGLLDGTLSQQRGASIAPADSSKTDLAAGEFSFSGHKILLVEDNEVNQLVAKYMLEHMGLHVDICGNGLEAIDQLNRSAYELILMDCQMPEMDGYEATLRIREGEAGETHAKIPIIALTANAMIGDRERCLEVGMNEHVAKPIEESALRNVLSRWIHTP
ncbi:hypothetical protein A3750_01810 [Oleiphilus sp. HI0079]|uniref:PAS domain-containing protein n=2 Tax=unclassified Oleiphilus TaxID=2631174 RepID=UPI0007C2B53F|nr:PAS domain-containing protein [Oleiphilus sp. HI0079]KZZ14592.1 hypothetical protein A3750_01810 [Oleiphilus sp. HI0079]KZZ80605.1 hypothetical protein A3767_10305 [Oleiphilus sp. HI0133]